MSDWCTGKKAWVEYLVTQYKLCLMWIKHYGINSTSLKLFCKLIYVIFVCTVCEKKKKPNFHSSTSVIFFFNVSNMWLGLYNYLNYTGVNCNSRNRLTFQGHFFPSIFNMGGIFVHFSSTFTPSPHTAPDLISCWPLWNPNDGVMETLFT